jgi:uncharacterized protein YggE
MQRIVWLLPGLLLMLCCSQAVAQFYPGYSSSPFAGAGTAQIQRPAERMLMFVEISASGSDVREASKAMTKKIDAAKKKLSELGADDKSVTTKPPRVDTGTSDASRRMRMMQMQMQRQLGNRAGKKKEEPETQTVTIKTLLQAEWPITGRDATEVLASAWELQEAVRDAKLAGTEEEAELSAEEQEALEEARMFSGDSDEQKPGEPAFVYKGSVKPEERAALLKQAFEKARASANEMATLAGMKLGTLNSIAESRSPTESWASYYDNGYNSSSYRLLQRMQQENAGEDDSLTMIGDSPSELVYSVSVTAGYGAAP